MADVAKKSDASKKADAAPRKADASKKAAAPAAEVRNINDLESEGIELQVAKETQKTGWKINTSPSSIDDQVILKKMLTTPPVKKIDLHFPLGLEVTARNLKGVTIKDAFDAIHKQYKKRADDELDNPYLAGFEWDREESWTRLIVHLQKESGASMTKKKKKSDE